jgi:RimJ/RimL family protein N-acetyltransferase
MAASQAPERADVDRRPSPALAALTSPGGSGGRPPETPRRTARRTIGPVDLLSLGNVAAPPERISAGPVTLRRVRATDAGAIAAAVSASMDHLRPWMPWANAAAGERRSQLTRVAEADQWWESGIGFTYSVVTAAGGTLVGEISLHRRAGDHMAEIGYWIAASQSGRGYATAAGTALTAVALALPGITRRMAPARPSRGRPVTGWTASRNASPRRPARAAG